MPLKCVRENKKPIVVIQLNKYQYISDVKTYVFFSGVDCIILEMFHKIIHLKFERRLTHHKRSNGFGKIFVYGTSKISPRISYYGRSPDLNLTLILYCLSIYHCLL